MKVLTHTAFSCMSNHVYTSHPRELTQQHHWEAGTPLLLLPGEELQSSEAPAALPVVVLPGPRKTRRFSTCAADTEL
jgi:hypothetical protein